jgi:excinuclease ABC subunit C
VNILKNIPNLPGVYLYRNKNNEIIYIGKAINLKKRVSQYFKKENTLGPKTQELVKNIAKIDYKIVGSEIEALVLESSLIKKHQPKYNIQLKDNKSYLYITIHKNYIETTRRIGDFGPFPSGAQVKYLLKILRRNFPFYTRPSHKKTCLYCHLGLCPKDDKENKKNIKIIKKILSGKTKSLFRELKSKLSKLKKTEDYEKAIFVRNSLKALEYISSGWKNISTLTETIQLSTDLTLQSSNELKLLLDIPQINRIECYDISQLGHKYFVGAMSVFQDGKIDPSQYRKFKIKKLFSPYLPRNGWGQGEIPRRGEGFLPNDPAMLREILTRRLKHSEWPYPDLIVLDGGLPQLSIIYDLPSTIFFIGLTKKQETIITTGGVEINLPPHSLALQLLQQLRDEAHRFANKYRKSLMKIN